MDWVASMTQTEKTQMADPPPYPGTPRWVKISGTIVGILVLLVVILVLFGGSPHGPVRHLSSSAGSGAGETLASSITV